MNHAQSLAELCIANGGFHSLTIVFSAGDIFTSISVESTFQWQLLIIRARKDRLVIHPKIQAYEKNSDLIDQKIWW